MGKAIPLSVRKRIVKLRQNGKKFRMISEEEQIPYSTVRRIWKRFEEKGILGLSTDYKNCGLKGCQRIKIKRVALWLRCLHLNWGVPFIYMILGDRYGLDALPSVRSIQLWFRAAGRNKVRAVSPTIEKKVQKIHECWQIDAKENLCLLDDRKACYLTIADKKFGAVLATPCFNKGKINQVSELAIRDELIKVFSIWGKPQSVRLIMVVHWVIHNARVFQLLVFG